MGQGFGSALLRFGGLESGEEGGLLWGVVRGGGPAAFAYVAGEEGVGGAGGEAVAAAGGADEFGELGAVGLGGEIAVREPGGIVCRQVWEVLTNEAQEGWT